MKVALDTNVLVYAEGINDAEKRDLALDLVRSLSGSDTFIPVQVLGELFNVLVRKAGRSQADARDALLGWRDTYSTIDTTAEVLLTATDQAGDHGLGIWDAIVLSSASRAGCRLLLSEDLQGGFTWGGLTVVNPFASTGHEALFP